MLKDGSSSRKKENRFVVAQGWWMQLPGEDEMRRGRGRKMSWIFRICWLLAALYLQDVAAQINRRGQSLFCPLFLPSPSSKYSNDAVQWCFCNHLYVIWHDWSHIKVDWCTGITLISHCKQFPFQSFSPLKRQTRSAPGIFDFRIFHAPFHNATLYESHIESEAS